MGEIIEVKVDKLEFWLENYRFGNANNQDDALDKLKDTRNFNSLVSSIKEYGFQFNNLLTVSKNKKDSGMYLVYDGNRRLAAVKQMPEITDLYVYEENDLKALNAILSRENSPSSTGRLPWTIVQQARWEKSLHDQELTGKPLSHNAKSLLIIEHVTGKPLDSNYPLSNFVRLYDSQDFTSRFGIDVSKKSVKVIEESKIQAIIEDIRGKNINSRNINTSDNIQKYLQMVLDGKPKEQRTNLTDDNENDEEVTDDEEQQSSRLFRSSELEVLQKHIKNTSLIHELRMAPVHKYPHLSILATRAVLDTLRNIDNESTEAPQALGKNDVSKYIDNNKWSKKIGQMVDTLCEHAHNLNKKSTKEQIDNNREWVNKLIEAVSASIDKPQ